MTSKSLKAALLVGSTAMVLVACGDSATELASPGLTVVEVPVPVPTPVPTPTPTPTPTPPAGSCPDGLTQQVLGGEIVCLVSGQLTDDLTLTAGPLYQLSGQVVVGIDTGPDGAAADGDSATLTVEPGVTVFGADTGATLVVSRGSQLVADGTQSSPIIFTSAYDLGLDDELGLDVPASRQTVYSGPELEEPYTSEWGGIQINGRATINTCNGDGICEADGEGDSGRYGGNDDEDSSGSMQYVQVLYAGNVITSSDELNGIAFQGVGRGTTLENIHVHNGADDGIEFFGGTADIRNAIITGADDDSLDWTFGWRGRGQGIIIIHNPNQSNSDQGIEADNNGNGNDFAPRANPILSNMTIVGAAPIVSDIGILLREGTAASIYNTVVANFSDSSLDIDGDASFAQLASGDISIQSTYLSSSTPVQGDSDNAANNFDTAAFLALDEDNSVGSNTLANIFINGAQENTVSPTDVNVIDSFFQNSTGIGAVANASANFTTGWSRGLNPDPTCPAGTVDGGTSCTLTGIIRDDVRLVAGLDYFLDGQVVVGVDAGPDSANPLSTADTAVLTIDPGVTIQARTLGDTLVISRGSELRSNGTADAPVIFTAGLDQLSSVDTDTSLWGGLQINGRATINTCNGSGICEADGEGDSGRYGGNDDEDSSGQLFYTRVDYAGNVITSSDELNGIAFQGTGRGTTVDYVQVHNNADDGIEFFGGTTDLRHAVITGADDDSLDWTFGWRGRGQFIVIAHNENQPSSDQGIEADNNGNGNDFVPRANPTLSNMTIVGAAPAVSDIGILLREGTAATIVNTVVDNFSDGCLDIDGDASFAQLAAGDIVLQSVLLGDGCGAFVQGDSDNAANSFDAAAFLALDANNATGTASLTARDGGTIAYINGTTEAGVTVTDPTALGSYFDAATQIGAVTADDDWTLGWTIFLGQ